MKTLLITLALLFTSVAAQADTLSLTLGSKHLMKHSIAEPYNEINPGFIYTFKSNYFVGAYINSYEGASPVAGKRWDKGNVGIELGAAFYPKHERGDNLLLPFAQVTYDVGPIRFGYAPMIDSNMNGIVTFQYVIDVD